jgi:hypothetical protein
MKEQIIQILRLLNSINDHLVVIVQSLQQDRDPHRGERVISRQPLAQAEE